MSFNNGRQLLCYSPTLQQPQGGGKSLRLIWCFSSCVASETWAQDVYFFLFSLKTTKNAVSVFSNQHKFFWQCCIVL